MISRMRRFIAAVLAAALVMGALPPQVNAKIVRVAVGKTGGMPVSPAGTTLTPGFPISVASLNRSFSAALIAPIITNPASAARPGVAYGNLAIPALAASVVTFAATVAAGEIAKAGSNTPFDGSARFEAREPGVPSTALRSAVNRLAQSRLGRFVPNALVAKVNAPAAPATAFSLDSHGGPQYEKLSPKEQARYGLRWGLHLTAISTVLSTALSAVASVLPEHASFPYIAGKLAAGSRMELLTAWGPSRIAEALAEQPATFVLWDLPASVLTEEGWYRLLWFAVPVMLLRALQPASELIVKRLDRVDSSAIFGLGRPMLLLAYGLNILSRYAFPLAAALSAVLFGKAHFAAWGLSAETFLVPAATGIALAYMTYQTRSFIPAVVAHFSYNTFLIGAIALAALSPTLAAGYGILLPAAAVIFLAYSLWTHYKQRAAVLGSSALKGLSAATAKVLALGVVAVAAVLIAAGPPQPSPGSMTASTPKPTAPIVLQEKSAAAKPLSAEEIVKAAKPAVVQILIQTPAGKTVGGGSGFIISRDGLVVTNDHVAGPVGIGGMVKVRFADGKIVPAVVLAANKRDTVDLAFLQLPPNPSGWPAVAIGDSSKLVEGAAVIAMGYPFGIDFTATKGIVSGIGGRRRAGYELQLDAAINSGNSGGPALNNEGEVIGVNTARVSIGEGIGLARSAATMLKFLEQYKQTGSISPAWLGVRVDLSNPLPGPKGVLIEAVRPDSPAAKAGLKPDDLILKINNRTLPPNPVGLRALSSMLLSKKLGDKVTLTVERNEEQLTLAVTLGEWLAKPDKLFRPDAPHDDKPDKDEPEEDEPAVTSVSAPGVGSRR